ncbi:MAG: sensor histidine kinase [bacterium]
MSGQSNKAKKPNRRKKPAEGAAGSWRLLLYYNVYRFGLAFLFGIQAYTLAKVLEYPDLLIILGAPATGLLLLSILTFYNFFRRSPSLKVQTHSTFLLEILLVGLIVLSGFLPQSTTIALYVTIAATALAFRLQVSFVYATICAILILFGNIPGSDFTSLTSNHLYFPLVTTIGLYVISCAIGYLARRTISDELTIEKRGIDLANLRKINQLVVNKLDVGIVVLDKTLNILQINDSAKIMIGKLVSMDRIEGKLASYIIQIVNSTKPARFTTHVGDNLLEVDTVPLLRGMLLKVENKTETANRTRESRLASVGRMASSIAHEIRNPLNAINHAAQLLTPLDDSDQQYSASIGSIRKNAKRIDRIVESVLERSRTGQAEQKKIELTPWLQNFIANFDIGEHEKRVRFNISGEEISIVFDPLQFEQILNNLCENSVSHSVTIGPLVEIIMHCGIDNLGNPSLEIFDYGRSLETTERENIFEPYQTSESGIDFFMVREICNINGADVEYVSDSYKSGFRILFLA